MDCLIAQCKHIVKRIVSSFDVRDISALKLCCVSFGALLAGIYPALVRGKRKLLWLLLFLTTTAFLCIKIFRIWQEE